MPGPALAAGAAGGLSFGFWGKLPARGDFLRAGLPASFVTPWDGWLSRVMAESRIRLGAAWLGAWLEAPIWRFALAPGLAGPEGAIGAWLPSVDRAGRHFPLTVALLVPGAGPLALLAAGGGWLEGAVASGLAAILEDLPPEELAARLADGLAEPDYPPPEAALGSGAAGLWWSEGGPRVAPGWQAGDALPDGPGFARMLADAAPEETPP